MTAIDPQNDAAKEKRQISPDAQRILDQIHTDRTQVLGAFEDLKKSVSADLAKIEILERPAVRAALERWAENETRLDAMFRKDGNLFDRVADAEAQLQRLGKVPTATASRDIRAEARKMFAREVETNPVFSDMLDIDPRLTPEYERGVFGFLQGGPTRVNAEQQKALGLGRSWMDTVHGLDANQLSAFMRQKEPMAALSSEFAPGAGIFVTPTMEARIRQKMVEGSALQLLAGRATTTSSVHEYIYETGHLPTTTERGERAAMPSDDDEKTYWRDGKIEVHEKDTAINMTRTMLADANRDIVAEFEKLVAKSRIKQMGQRLVTGTGSGQGQGIMMDDRIKKVVSGSATTFPFARITLMTLDLHPEYLANAQFAISVGALTSLALEVDGQNRPLWQPSLQDGTPSLLAGYRWHREPYYTSYSNISSDSKATFATGAKVATFGDHAEAFLIVSRSGVVVVRDEVTTPGRVIYRWYFRDGHAVVMPDAIRILQVGT